MSELVEMSDTDCFDNLHVNRSAFNRLCYLLRHMEGLVDGRYVTVGEQVALFLSVLSHHSKVRVLKFSFKRSSQTIHTYFHNVLRAILKFHEVLLAKPTSMDDDCTHPSVAAGIIPQHSSLISALTPQDQWDTSDTSRDPNGIIQETIPGYQSLRGTQGHIRDQPEVYVISPELVERTSDTSRDRHQEKTYRGRQEYQSAGFVGSCIKCVSVLQDKHLMSLRRSRQKIYTQPCRKGMFSEYSVEVWLSAKHSTCFRSKIPRYVPEVDRELT
ncbi:hypothetical protein ACS0TY_031283 [Phlomoides rotata]